VYLVISESVFLVLEPQS
jgi:hypothetical protein